MPLKRIFAHLTAGIAAGLVAQIALWVYLGHPPEQGWRFGIACVLVAVWGIVRTHTIGRLEHRDATLR